jgi:hypothetical protein
MEQYREILEFSALVFFNLFSFLAVILFLLAIIFLFQIKKKIEELLTVTSYTVTNINETVENLSDFIPKKKPESKIIGVIKNLFF